MMREGKQAEARTHRFAWLASGACVIVLALTFAPRAQAQETGSLLQQFGLYGCVNETGTLFCTDGQALDMAASVAVSPDGKSVYVASQLSDAVAVFSRNTTGGEVTQLLGTDGCVSETGTAGACADGKALDGATSVAVSADNKTVYVASQVSDAVAVFSRNTTTGKLTQLAGTAGCVSETGTGGACVDGKGLDGAQSVTGSADSKSVYAASNVSDAVAAFSRNTTSGQITQLAGTAGCVSETGSAGACIDGKGLDGVQSVAVSPESTSVYAASQVSDAVVAFSRNTTSGQITQLAGTAGCVSETGSAGACTDGKALDGAAGVAVSPDKKSVYVASQNSDAVAAFSRNTTSGQLTQLAGTAGCVSETGTGGTCINGKALDGAYGVAVSPDKKTVYVASRISDAVAAYPRNTISGKLSQLAGTTGCVSETGTTGTCTDGRALDGARSVAVSANGKNAYVAADVSDALVVFDRVVNVGKLTQLAGTAGCTSETGTSGTCVDGAALDEPQSTALSPDGKNLYVASLRSDAVAVFSRNSTTGALTQLAGTSGCVSQTGSAGACTDGRALDGATSVAVSADGTSVYVASSISNAAAVFSRNTTTGALTQLAGVSGCVSDNGLDPSDPTTTCTNGTALQEPSSVAVSADSTSVYVASRFGNSVANFARNTTTGVLTQLAGTAGCVSDDGTGGACTDGRALALPVSMVVSPDKKSVYVVSSNNAVAAFSRNTTTGAITQLAGTAGCVNEDASGGCADGRALHGPASIAVSANGRSLYVASELSDALAVFSRNTTTGALTQLADTAGCVSDAGFDPFDPSTACIDGAGLDGPRGVAVSADGKSVYAASSNSDSVATLERNTISGKLTPLIAANTCVSEDGTGGACTDGKALNGARAVVVSGDLKHVYVASRDSDAIAAFKREL